MPDPSDEAVQAVAGFLKALHEAPEGTVVDMPGLLFSDGVWSVRGESDE